MTNFSDVIKSSFANHKECQICKNKMKLVYYNNKTQGFSIIH